VKNLEDQRNFRGSEEPWKLPGNPPLRRIVCSFWIFENAIRWGGIDLQEIIVRQ
jgi:hypothetical protein